MEVVSGLRNLLRAPTKRVGDTMLKLKERSSVQPAPHNSTQTKVLTPLLPLPPLVLQPKPTQTPNSTPNFINHACHHPCHAAAGCHRGASRCGHHHGHPRIQGFQEWSGHPSAPAAAAVADRGLPHGFWGFGRPMQLGCRLRLRVLQGWERQRQNLLVCLCGIYFGCRPRRCLLLLLRSGPGG